MKRPSQSRNAVSRGVFATAAAMWASLAVLWSSLCPWTPWRIRHGSLLALAIVLLSAPAFAQPDSTPKALELQSQAFEAIGNAEYPKAERLLREQLKLDEGNFVIYYNLACVRDLQDDGPGAAKFLVDAVEHGFVDLHQLRRDPQLQHAREQPEIKALIGNWPKVLERQVDANVRATREFFKDKPKPYLENRDDKLRLVYLSAMDVQSTDQARADIARLYQWAIASVFPELADDDKSKRDAWTVVVLPTSRDFLRWATMNFGAAAVNPTLGAGIGGAYMNDYKRLVAQDLGATLRHEYFHVLHWRDMIRHGQIQAIWVQEGLCSLVEDYEIGAGPADLKPVPSWRTNISKRLAQDNHLMSIKQLTSIPQDKFTGDRPLSNYAQARTLFLYLYQKGKLKDWYAAYISTFRSDSTGVKAFEQVFEKPIADIDKDYKAWARALPTVAEQIKPGEASLGVEVDPGTGDGPTIAEFYSDKHGPPNQARLAGLKVGDVITAIDGKPTRDLNELVRLLGERKVGDQVEVSYRRGQTHNSAKVTLVRR